MNKKPLKTKWIAVRPVLLSFGAPFVILACIQLVLLLKYNAAVIGGDCTAQMLPFMAEFRRKVLSGESLLYSWSGGGGFDFWAVYCYYLSSPFTWLSLLVKESDLPLFINFLVLIKISLSGASFGYYLHAKKICKNEAQIALFATLFALCGFTAAYSLDIMWLDVVALFPLLILGMDKLVYNKKPALYTLSLAVTFMCNYYLGFTVAVGVFFYYFTFRFESFRDFVSKSLRIISFSVLSAASCAVFLIPSFLVAGEAGRTQSDVQIGFFENFTDSIRNLLFYDTPISVSDSPSTANIYVTLFALFFFFFWFFAGKDSLRAKIKNGIIIAFLFLSFNLGILNMLWHGFRMPILVQNRFSFMLCFVLLVLAARAFALRNTLDKAKAGIGGAVFCAVVFALGMIDKDNTRRFGLSILAAVVYLIVFFALGKKPKIQFISYAVCAMTGVIVCFSLAIKNNTGQELNGIYEPAVQEAVQETQDTDSALYREKDLCLTEKIGTNVQTLYGLRGFPIFSSYVNSNQTAQFIRFGLVNYMWNSIAIQYFDGQNLGNYHAPNTLNIVADSLSGVQKVYAYDDYKVNSDLLTKVYEKDGVCVYENAYALPIAYMLDDSLVEKIGNLGMFPHSVYNAIAKNFDLALYTSCVTGISPAENTKAAKTQSGTFSIYSTDEEDLQVTFSYTVRENNTALTLYFGGQNEVDVTVTNGDEVRYESTGFLSDFPDLGTFSKGDKVEITISGAATATMSVELLSFNRDAFTAMLEKLQNGALQITQSSANFIKGTVIANENQTLFTTIPASKYWSAKVDGESVELSSFDNGFLMLPLTAGEHEVEFTYTSPLFWLCLAISAAGIALSFVVFILYNNENKKAARKDIDKNEC